jgi:hypothetical protein
MCVFQGSAPATSRNVIIFSSMEIAAAAVMRTVLTAYPTTAVVWALARLRDTTSVRWDVSRRMMCSSTRVVDVTEKIRGA